MFNPPATLPFCPDQTDFLCFSSPEGFSAIMLDLIEGFTAGVIEEATGKLNPNLTTIQLLNNNQYFSTESVPVLVARFAEVKRRRYSKTRAENERCEKNPLVPPTAAAAATSTPAPAPAPTSSLWKKPAG